MPGKRRNGDGDGGKVTDVTVKILRAIRLELSKMRDEQRTTNARLESLETLGRATVAGLSELRSRFDYLLDFAGERHRDHEERIRALEKHLRDAPK